MSCYSVLWNPLGIGLVHLFCGFRIVENIVSFKLVVHFVYKHALICFLPFSIESFFFETNLIEK